MSLVFYHRLLGCWYQFRRLIEVFNNIELRGRLTELELGYFKGISLYTLRGRKSFGLKSSTKSFPSSEFRFNNSSSYFFFSIDIFWASNPSPASDALSDESMWRKRYLDPSRVNKYKYIVNNEMGYWPEPRRENNINFYGRRVIIILIIINIMG